MTKTNTGDTYTATGAYAVKREAQFVKDLEAATVFGEVQASPTNFTLLARLKDIVTALNTLLNAGAGVGPGKGFVKLEDSTAGVDLTDVRALLFTTAGTITLTDGNGHTETGVSVVAGQMIPCEFTHAVDIACTVYAIT